MRDVFEYFPKLQGRPYTPVRRDLEGGQSVAESDTTALRREYMELKTIVDKLLNEQVQKLEALLIETKQIKLHLASLSEADISEDDVDTEG